MNANELADFVEISKPDDKAHQLIATMLRQQAKELDEAGHMIGVLREYISDLENGLDSSIKLNKAQAERNNEPVALTQGDILGILQDANSVPLGQPIFNSSEEYNKLKAIIESAIRYTHPVKELTDEVWSKAFDFYCETDEGVLKFDLELRDEWKKEQLIRWKEALRKAQEK